MSGPFRVGPWTSLLSVGDAVEVRWHRIDDPDDLDSGVSAAWRPAVILALDPLAVLFRDGERVALPDAGRIQPPRERTPMTIEETLAALGATSREERRLARIILQPLRRHLERCGKCGDCAELGRMLAERETPAPITRPAPERSPA